MCIRDSIYTTTKWLNRRKDLILRLCFKSLQEQIQKNSEESIAEFNELKRSNEEFKKSNRAEVKDFKEQLSTKLEENNTRVRVPEARAENSLN